jgi:O-antigen/teichoic acid export membrane protein
MADEKRRIGNENEKHRWDRNFADLLQELRVAQTGIQILFAFLLTLPFSNGFPNTTQFQKDIYILALLSAAVSTAMIISPVAFHRALFRQGRKPELVRYAHRMATGGLAFLLIAMVSSVFLIVDYLQSRSIALLLGGLTALCFLTFWAAIPWYRHNWIDEDAEEVDEEVTQPERDPGSRPDRRDG